MTKKIRAASIALIMAASCVFSAPTERSRVIVFTPDTENVTGAEKSWLPGAVRDKLESNLRAYTSFVLIDSANESKIKSLQMESEGGARDSAAAIEVGKLTSASHAVFSTVRRAGKTFSISSGLTDLTSGARLAFSMASRESVDELFNGAGCAIDELTISLCAQLSLDLSPSQIYVLRHGDSSLSSSERLEMSRKEMEAFQRQIEEIDRQITALSLSADLTAEAEKSKLEAEKALAEERKAASEEKARRLAKDDERREADAKKDAERSAESVRRRDELSAQLGARVKAARSAKIEGLSTLEALQMIESKKRALIEIREAARESADERRAEAEEEFKRKSAEISGREYRLAEKDSSGQPTMEAVGLREKEMEEAKREIDGRAERDAAAASAAVAKEDKALLSEIESDLKSVAKKRSITSLGDDLSVSFARFDGNTKSWEVSIRAYSGGQPFCAFTSFVNYGDLPGIDGLALPLPSKDRDKYLDTVDVYDSLFCRGDPVLTFELDYKVAPRASKFPSEYTVTFTELRARDTRSGKVISALVPFPAETVKKFTPARDMRPFETQEKIAARAEIKAGKAKEKRTKAAERKRIADSMSKINRTGIGINGGSKNTNFDFSYSILKFLFAGFDCGVNYALPGEWRGEIEERNSYETGLDVYDYIFFFDAYIGLNFSFFIGKFRPTIYGTFGVGWGAARYDTSSAVFETDGSLLLVQTAGITFPVTSSGIFQLVFEYMRQDFMDYTAVHSFSGGIRWVFPTKTAR